MKLALIGDLHLDHRSARYQHVLDVLEYAVADAIAAGATGFIFLGDLWEGLPGPGEFVPLARQTHRIKQAGGWVVFIEGNHEEYEAGVMLEWIGTRRVAWSSFEALHDEATILCVPYPRRGRAPVDDLGNDKTIAGTMRAAAARITEEVRGAIASTRAVDTTEVVTTPTPVIVCGHFTIAGMTTRDTTFESHRADEVIVPQEAFTNVALCAVGHVHKAQDVAPNIIGVGALTRQDFAEAEDGTKSYTLVTVEGGRVTWERRPVPAREMVEVNLSLLPGGEIVLPPDIAEQVRGKEVKVRLTIAEEMAPLFDESVLSSLKEAAAFYILDRSTIPTERVRAPEIVKAETLWDEVQTWIRSTGQVLSPDREELIRHKVDEIEETVRTA